MNSKWKWLIRWFDFTHCCWCFGQWQLLQFPLVEVREQLHIHGMKVCYLCLKCATAATSGISHVQSECFNTNNCYLCLQHVIATSGISQVQSELFNTDNWSCRGHNKSKVPNQNGVSQAWYTVQIHHSGWETLIRKETVKEFVKHVKHVSLSLWVYGIALTKMLCICYVF